MNNAKRALFLLIALPLLSNLINTSRANANPTDQVIQSSEQSVNAARSSQQRINKLDDERSTLLSRFRQESRRLDDLIHYNQQMTALVEEQRKKQIDIKQTLQNIATTERQIMPLLNRMIDSLEAFIQLDLPFLLDERTARIERLKRLMQQPDMSIAEKFRQVFEAYEIELSYSNSLESYRGTLPGSQQDVEFLRIGRIGLAFQTLDGKTVGAWDRNSKQWLTVPAKYRRDIQKGLRMAKEQIAANLIKIPLNAATRAPKTQEAR